MNLKFTLDWGKIKLELLYKDVLILHHWELIITIDILRSKKEWGCWSIFESNWEAYDFMITSLIYDYDNTR